MGMDVCLIDVGADDKSMITFGQGHGQLVAELVCFLRGNLSRLERLAQMVGDYAVLIVFPGFFT